MEDLNYRELIEEVRKTKNLIALAFVSKDDSLTADLKMRVLDYAGFKQSEIGELLGIRQGTVSKHLKKVKPSKKQDPPK